MSPDVIAVSIPVFGILGGVAVAIVSLLNSHRLRLQRADLRHRERLAMIDKGLELPTDTPDSDARATDESKFLRQGLVLLGVGATITIGMMQIPNNDVPYLFGLVPCAIGAAYLLYYFIHGRNVGRPGTVPPRGPDGTP